MQAVIDAMSTPQPLWGSSKHSRSLADLGYLSVGIDDGWQSCGSGVAGSFHDAAGNPLVNTSRFPLQLLQVK